jgi:TPR repeat protein
MRRAFFILAVFLPGICTGGWFGSSNDSELRQLQSGLEAFESHEYKKAYDIWYEQAAWGNAEAKYHIGWMYANGNGFPVDVPQAILWWTAASDLGHADSQFAIGVNYMTGDGKTIKRDTDKAIEWLKKAAENNQPEAQDMLRNLYKSHRNRVLKLYPDIKNSTWFKAQKSAK